jgi:NADH dehydrogenase
MDDVLATPAEPSEAPAVPAHSRGTANRVLVTGAAGFIGHHTCRALAAAGYEVVGLVRKIPKENDALVGVSYIVGDVKDVSSLSREAFAGCRAIVHLVGIITEIRSRGQTFESVHVEGTRNLLSAARAAAGEGLQRFVYVSAQGASPQSRSAYSRTKAHAEQLVRESDIPYTIFRPSLVLGPGGEFVAQIESLIKKPPLSPTALPFVPVPGRGENKFQPVYVEDLTTAIVRSLDEPSARDQTFEIGGADAVTFNQLIEAFERHVGTKKRLLHLPLPLMFAVASVLVALLPAPPITPDQLINLGTDNVCDNEAIKQALAADPVGLEEALSAIYAHEASD